MNWQIVKTIFLHELRMLLRYRRTVVLAIVLPLLTAPLILFTTKIITDRQERDLSETTFEYAITGTEADRLRERIARARERLALAAAESGEMPEELRDFKFEEVSVPDPLESLRTEAIHFYLEAFSGAEADALEEEESKEKEPAEKEETPEGVGRKVTSSSEPLRLPGVPLVRINYFADRRDSGTGRTLMRELLALERRSERSEILRRQGFPTDPDSVIPIEEADLASAGQVTGSYVGRFLTLILMMLMLSGGSVVAMDIIAGEKERGSLETLLTSAASRGEIVAAKQLLILSVAATIAVIHVLNILVYITFRLIELPADWVIEAPPVTIITLLLLFIPFAAFVAAVLLMLSAYAKSYKEAQLYFFPVYLVSWAPALAAMLPGISLRSAIVVVPIANVSVAVREIMVGKFDWPMILIVIAVMTAVAVLTVRASARMLSQERLITASEADASDLAGGPALFPKHVLRWYAVMGALLFAAAVNVPQLSTMEGQVLFNELAIFLGVPLLMIRKYKLDFREALALRRVKPAVWLAVLLAIPSGNLVAIGVFRLADFVVPVPERMLEEFGRQMLPPDKPLWLLILLLAVLPGICEEIGFRGTLLYGLRRKFRPVTLALVVGLIFGLFHVAIFRIIPTAFLGVVLTAIALLTGSIFPGMVVHTGNNALALWVGKSETATGEFEWWVYFTAAAVFALSFVILYRNRTPYPGLLNGRLPNR